MSQLAQLCTFYVDGLLLGVEVENVQEVIRYQEMTRVPLAPAVIGGLINLRGQIVTAVDLRQRLGLHSRSQGTLPMNVVVRTDDGAMSLLVDEIGDVVEVEEASFEAAPDTLAPEARELIRGVYKLKRDLLLLLDTDKAVNSAVMAIAHTA
ncbi:MAG TPA: chemotaxis protein CheW [candidate division Zixibacteria bacterium]|nr:chemotaxis protein CheW [candidate division Zixibacteria bacterium]